MELLDYEKKHIDFLKENASECTLFLKRNNVFPLDKPCDLVLVGNGARKTIKGGTGSGDVASRFFKTVEAAFTEQGFNITSTKWLDEYDAFGKESRKEYVRDCKRLARKIHMLASVYSVGFFEEEKNYDISCREYEGEACIYVLARNSGEGNDRRNIKGDVKLSDKEVSDILYLNNKFKKFMLVLNVGGVIDLTPVLSVSNILLLSQLGVVTGDILANIVLGKNNPSGKLTTTWARPEDYPFFNEFGDLNDTYYKEGIYVGYRYFNTLNKEVMFPFGYGLSYTDFDIKVIDTKLDEMLLNIKVNVKNIGAYAGKEVIQIYVTKPNKVLDNPYVELCGYQKTKELLPNEDTILNFNLDLTKLTNYDEKRAATILQQGDYIIRIGNSSLNLKDVCKCALNEEIIVEQLANKCFDKAFIDYKCEHQNEEITDLKTLVLNPQIKTRIVEYKKDTYQDEMIATLPNESLANICLGHHKGGFLGVVGESSHHVVGAAGETVLSVPEIKKSLTMSDGPAGIRIIQQYGVDEKGTYNITLDPLMDQLLDFLPKITYPFILPKRNRKGEIHYQFTTAIPIGTALAQSFNDEFLYGCGNLVAEEMEHFGIDLWLAPALNIHRNILCGRNFEYYSEDPYLSGHIAASITRGVESHKCLGVTLKHFTANNQEINRYNNNSHLSERALREIYLKGFEICIKEARPKALMTSYNLINGIHTSESYELINDILRCEWGYDGLVMSDWIQSGRSFYGRSFYPAPYASNNILAGNDLTMPGANKDYKNIMKALKQGKLSREDLIYSASRIYRTIKEKG